MNDTRDVITQTEDGWIYRGRTYRTLNEATKAAAQPTVIIPRELAVFTDMNFAEEMPAYEVLVVLADALAAMMRAPSEIRFDDPETGVPQIDELADEVNKTLAVCSVRLRDTARKIGPPPIDTNGAF